MCIVWQKHARTSHNSDNIYLHRISEKDVSGHQIFQINSIYTNLDGRKTSQSPLCGT